VTAASWARAMSAELDVLNVVAQGNVERPEGLAEITRNFGDAVGEAAKDFLRPQTFIGAGNAQEQILKHLRERSVDLLILGIHKSSHLGLMTRTSGAFQLIVDAECPVLTVSGESEKG